MLSELLETYKWPIICAGIGLVIGILFLTLGFLKTVLILLLTIIGGCLGMYLQKSQIMEQFFENRKN